MYFKIIYELLTPFINNKPFKRIVEIDKIYLTKGDSYIVIFFSSELSSRRVLEGFPHFLDREVIIFLLFLYSISLNHFH